MKLTKKVLSVFLALMMVAGIGCTSLMAMSETAHAAQTGTLTVNGTTAGKTYAVYKVFDLTQSGDNYSYTVNSDFAQYFKDNGIADPVEHISKMSGNSAELSKLAQSIFKWASEKGIAPAAKKTADGNSMTIDGLGYGYYLLNPLGGSKADNGYATMFSMNTLSGNDTEINVKAVYPTVDKEIKDEGKTNSASIGDDVTYVLKSAVPDMTGYKGYYFIFNDTLSKGLTYKDVDSITVGGKKLEKADYEVEGPDAADNGATKIRIILKDFFNKYKDQAGADIVVEYKATLNKDAEAGKAEKNKASLTYSNDPSYNYDGDKPAPGSNAPVGETATTETETYTTSLTINKTDGKNKLTGAAFRITGDGVNIVVTTGDVYTKAADGTFWKLKDSTYTTDDPNGADMDKSKYESTTDKYKKEAKAVIDTKGAKVNAEAFVNADGTLTFTGLGAGSYTISEIVVPDGYNAIEDINVDITFDKAEKKFTANASNGNTVSVDGNKLSMTVVNKSGNLLPSTGGIGTQIFYILGAILLIGGGAVLFGRRKIRNNG